MTPKSASLTTHLALDADRLLYVALGCSLFGHALILTAWLISSRRIALPHPRGPAKLTYEPESSRAKTRLSEALIPGRANVGGRSGSAYLPTAEAVAGSRGGALGSTLETASTIRIANSFGPSALSVALPQSGAWGEAIDLTNLGAVSQGDPILYTYFSAMREQIQRTANTQMWLPAVAAPGTVYIGFIVNRTGGIQSVEVVPDRSANSAVLQDAAQRIIKAASPFLPFPPSCQDAAKAIVVPIEFSVGTSSLGTATDF